MLNEGASRWIVAEEVWTEQKSNPRVEVSGRPKDVMESPPAYRCSFVEPYCECAAQRNTSKLNYQWIIV